MTDARVPWTGQDGLSETSGLPYPRNAERVTGTRPEDVLAAYNELRRQNDGARALLRRLLQWDHLPLTGDGPYWIREIEKVLRDG